jgi:hypothetical protein
MSHKIVRLVAENYKRLKAADITPRSHVVSVASEKNEQGKSSLLDSILAAFGGAEGIAKKPIRTGQDSASIEIDMGDIIVTRNFTAGGTTVVVKNAEGLKYPSPQAVLDKMYGKVAFDPFEFSRLDIAEQSLTLRKLVGLDFKQLDEQKQMVYEARTEEGRDLRSLEARLKPLKFVEGLPEEEETTMAIFSAQKRASETNSKNAVYRSQLQAKERDFNATGEHIAKLDAEIKKLQTQLAREQAHQNEVAKEVAEMREHASKLVDIDLSPFATKAKELEEKNAQIRQNKEFNTLKQQVFEKKTTVDDYTNRLAKIEEEKSKLIREAKYPIEGLSIDVDGEILYQGTPLSQSSSAAKIRVSVAIAIALNPDLKVMIIREGSLLDKDNLAMIGDMAAKSDSQVWIEMVGIGDDVGVIIEDGEVIGGPAVTTPEEKEAKKAKKKPAIPAPAPIKQGGLL